MVASSDCSGGYCSLVEEKRWDTIIIGKVDGRFLTFAFRLSFFVLSVSQWAQWLQIQDISFLSFGPFSLNTPPSSRSSVLSWQC